MKQLQFVFSVVIVILISSCSKKSALQELIGEADVVKVYIETGGPVPMVHYETNDIDKIKMWSGYIDEKTNASADSRYEGKLIFKVYEDSTLMQFSLKPGCEQVSYKLNDTLFVKKLTPEGISFLNELKKIQ